MSAPGSFKASPEVPLTQAEALALVDTRVATTSSVTDVAARMFNVADETDDRVLSDMLGEARDRLLGHLRESFPPAGSANAVPNENLFLLRGWIRGALVGPSGVEPGVGVDPDADDSPLLARTFLWETSTSARADISASDFLTDALVTYRELGGMYGFENLSGRVRDTAIALRWLANVAGDSLLVAEIAERRMRLSLGGSPQSDRSPSDASQLVARLADTRIGDLKRQVEEARREVAERDAEISELRLSSRRMADEVARLTSVLRTTQSRNKDLSRRAKRFAKAARAPRADAGAQRALQDLRRRFAALQERMRGIPGDIHRFFWEHGRGEGDFSAWTAFVAAFAAGSPAQIPPGVTLGIYVKPTALVGPPAKVSSDLGLTADELARFARGSDDDESPIDLTGSDPSVTGRRERRASALDSSTLTSLMLKDQDAAVADLLQDEEESSDDAMSDAADGSVHSEDLASPSDDEKPETKQRGTPARTARSVRVKRRSQSSLLTMPLGQLATRDIPPASARPRPFTLRTTRLPGGMLALGTFSDADSKSLDLTSYVLQTSLPAADRAAMLRLPQPTARLGRVGPFVPVKHPFPLGQVVCRSSTMSYSSDQEPHRDVFLGYPTRVVKGAASAPYFPNYQLQAGSFASIFQALSSDYEAVRRLAASRPWDAMWRARVTHLFLFDPNEFTLDHSEWIQAALKFMYTFREAYWWRTHWLCLPKDQASLPSEWSAFAKHRLELDRRLVKGFAALNKRRPETLPPSIWFEPSLWRVPYTTCQWPTRPSSKVSLQDQLERLEFEEPIRGYWSKHPGRFVEAIFPEHYALLYSREGLCWELPRPWGDPSYTPKLTLAEIQASVISAVADDDSDELDDPPQAPASQASQASSSQGAPTGHESQAMSDAEALRRDLGSSDEEAEPPAKKTRSTQGTPSSARTSPARRTSASFQTSHAPSA